MNLSDVYRIFPNTQSCIRFIEVFYWNGHPQCPYCKSKNISIMGNDNRYHCNSCNNSFSITVRTIFHKTRVDLQKWFYLIFLVMESDSLNSLRSIGEELKITKDTVNSMLNKIKKAIPTNNDLFITIIKSLK
jgi:transposase-like protein